MWWLSGIFRDVTLLSRPAGGVDDVFVHAGYDARTGAGRLRVDSGAGARVTIGEIGVEAAAGQTVTIGGIEPFGRPSAH